jgi:hypothetical protein
VIPNPISKPGLCSGGAADAVPHGIQAAIIALAVALSASEALGQYKEACQAGQECQRAGKYEEARMSWEKSLSLASTPVQKAAAHIGVGLAYEGEKKYSLARAEFEKALAIGGIAPEQAAQARFRVGADLYWERQYPSARAELSKVLAQDNAPAEWKAQSHIFIGRSWQREAKTTEAAAAYARVLAMPGASDKQVHEARLRLHLGKLLPADEGSVTVLFIGASHTQVWNIPQMVEVLAASAPAGCPRIISGEYLRGGTSIRKFWDEGDGPQTVRAVIAEDSWDFVVFECYPFLFGDEECADYAAKFAGLIRRGHGVPVLFDAPAFFRVPYPAKCRDNHDRNLKLARNLGLRIAPAGLAWINYLGPAPTPEQRMALYHPDAVHTSPKGAYMIACSIYSAITGCSPVGLTHVIPSFSSSGISREEAMACQNASWKACQESKTGPGPVE